MRILATFDASPCSETALTQLKWLAVLSDVEFVLLSVAEEPTGSRVAPARATIVAGMATEPTVVGIPETRYAESKLQAIDRRRADLASYLRGLVAKLPIGPRYSIETCVAAHAGTAIIERAIRLQPDLIVMGTHDRTGFVRLLVGSVAAEVVRAAVAPVLLVPPGSVSAVA